MPPTGLVRHDGGLGVWYDAIDGDDHPQRYSAALSNDCWFPPGSLFFQGQCKLVLRYSAEGLLRICAPRCSLQAAIRICSVSNKVFKPRRCVGRFNFPARRGPFAVPTESEMIEYLTHRVKSDQQRPRFEELGQGGGKTPPHCLHIRALQLVSF